jgi:hypothetical protein
MVKKIVITLIIGIGCFGWGYTEQIPKKIILFISEQNISGPQRAWWAGEVDLSVTESIVANKLIENGYTVLEPSSLNKVIKQDKAFRLVNISEQKLIKLGSLAKADYIVLGKAIASAGSNVPQSNMRSCFANITAKLIRVKDGKVIAYLDASGSSVHMDVITGGKESLSNAGEVLAIKIMDVLSKEGVKR